MSEHEHDHPDPPVDQGSRRARLSGRLRVLLAGGLLAAVATTAVITSAAGDDPKESVAADATSEPVPTPTSTLPTVALGDQGSTRMYCDQVLPDLLSDANGIVDAMEAGTMTREMGMHKADLPYALMSTEADLNAPEPLATYMEAASHVLFQIATGDEIPFYVDYHDAVDAINAVCGTV